MSNFNYLVKRGVGSVFRNGMMSIASFFVLLVSLLLIGLSVLVAMDIGVIMSNIEEKNEISVYVYGDVDQTTLNHITDALNENPNRLNVVFYSKEQAWEDKKNEMSEYKELFDYLTECPTLSALR